MYKTVMNQIQKSTHNKVPNFPAASVDAVYPDCASNGGYQLMGQFYRSFTHESADAAEQRCAGEGMHLLRARDEQEYAALLMISCEHCEHFSYRMI